MTVFGWKLEIIEISTKKKRKLNGLDNNPLFLIATRRRIIEVEEFEGWNLPHSCINYSEIIIILW